MTDQLTFQPNSTAYSSVGRLLMLGGFVLIGLVLGQALGMTLAAVQLGVSFEDFGKLTEKPLQHPELWLGIMLVQGASALSGFVIAPLLFWRLVMRQSWQTFLASPAPSTYAYVLVGVLVVAAMPFNGWVVALNKSMQLPAFLEGVETWMRQKEDSLADLTKLLTTISSPWQLAVAMLVVAVIPALGEELLFRGMIQPLFARSGGNHHVGIWASAAVFSATHLQFYGFVPRLLLGVLFGYLYHWSRDLRVPIVAHFVNNGFSLFMLYLFQQRLTAINVEESHSVPLAAAAGSALITLLLLRIFYNQTTTKP